MTRSSTSVAFYVNDEYVGDTMPSPLPNDIVVYVKIEDGKDTTMHMNDMDEYGENSEVVLQRYIDFIEKELEVVTSYESSKGEENGKDE